MKFFSYANTRNRDVRPKARFEVDLFFNGSCPAVKSGSIFPLGIPHGPRPRRVFEAAPTKHRKRKFEWWSTKHHTHTHKHKNPMNYGYIHAISWSCGRGTLKTISKRLKWGDLGRKREEQTSQAVKLSKRVDFRSTKRLKEVRTCTRNKTRNCNVNKYQQNKGGKQVSESVGRRKGLGGHWPGSKRPCWPDTKK